MPSRELLLYHQVGLIKMNYMGSKSDSLTRHDPYIYSYKWRCDNSDDVSDDDNSNDDVD